MKTAIVTGVTGQDGAYLAQLLIEKGYKVYGTVRRTSSSLLTRLEYLNIRDKIELVDMELLEQSNVARVIRRIQPDLFFNLAAQSFVALSFEEPVYVAQVNAISVLYILEAIRDFSPQTRYYQASTSEMYGKVQETPQKETTPFYPRSPYAVAKLYGHWITVNYRESYDLHISSGILFNHESPLRGTEFVTRKITQQLALIKYGLADVLELGNMEALRDWGYAGDYVEAMYLMTQQAEGDTYVVASGETHKVREFVQLTLDGMGFKSRWEGEGENLVCYDADTNKLIIRINSKFYRPTEVEVLRGDPTKAKEKLNWTPKHSFLDLVDMMIVADLDRAKARAVVAT